MKSSNIPNDQKTTIAQLLMWVEKFIQERDWEQFHNLKNISMNIGIEVAELQEHFLWYTEAQCLEVLDTKRDEIEAEVADVAFALINFCKLANIDLSQALAKKIEATAKKYPIEKAKGCVLKYTEIN